MNVPRTKRLTREVELTSREFSLASRPSAAQQDVDFALEVLATGRIVASEAWVGSTCERVIETAQWCSSTPEVDAGGKLLPWSVQGGPVALAVIDNQTEDGGLRKLGNESKFVLARSCRAHSSEDAKRLLMVPWPTSQGPEDTSGMQSKTCEVFCYVVDMQTFIEASRLLRDGQLRAILDIDETLISAHIYDDLKTAAAKAATASQAALAAQDQFTKGSQEWLERWREFNLHNTIKARAKYWLKCMKAFRDGGSKACDVPGCRLAEGYKHAHCGEQDGLDTYIVATNNQNLAKSVTLVVIRPWIPALLQTLEKNTWMVHVCTHAHRTHGTAAMLLADPGQRVFPDGVDDQDAAMQCVPYPTKKSLSAIYRTAAAAPPPPPAPVAGASAAGPAGATTAGSSRAPPTASLPVTAPGAAEGTTGVTQAVMPRPASRPFTLVLDNKSRAWLLEDRHCIYECPDFVALEAQAVSYLTQSAKYGRHTIPPEVLNRVEHSNAAAAVFDQQLQYIESTMGDAKHEQRTRVKAFLRDPMACSGSLQQLRTVLGVPPTMAKALHDFAAAAAQQQQQQEEEEQEQQQQQQQQHAYLAGQQELQEQECHERRSLEARKRQALEDGDFEMYAAACEQEDEIKEAAAAHLAASAQRHAAAGLAGSTDRSKLGRRAASKGSDLLQTEGFDPLVSLMHTAGGQAHPLPSVDSEEADPELQEPQRLLKRRKACADNPCEEYFPNAAAAAAKAPSPPPQQQNSSWPAATAAVSELQQATAAPGTAARADADEAAATGPAGSVRSIFEVNVSRNSAPAAAAGSPTGQQLQQTGSATLSADHCKGRGHYKQQRSGSYNSDNGNPMGQHSLQPRHGSHTAGLQQQWSPQELARQQRQQQHEAELHQHCMQQQYDQWLQQQQQQELAHAEALYTAQQQQRQQQHPGATSAPAPADSSKQPSSPPGELPLMPDRVQLRNQYNVHIQPCGLSAVPAEQAAVWGQDGKYVCAKYYKETIAWGSGQTVQEAESDAVGKAVLALQERKLLGQAVSSHGPPMSDIQDHEQAHAASTPPPAQRGGKLPEAAPRLHHLPKDNTPKAHSRTLEEKRHTNRAPPGVTGASVTRQCTPARHQQAGGKGSSPNGQTPAGGLRQPAVAVADARLQQRQHTQQQHQPQHESQIR